MGNRRSIVKRDAVSIDKWLVCLFILLCFPAFLIHLGLVPYIEDESIRILVAQEMKLTGDWLVPHLNGVEYLKKPPLYNWLIALSCSLTATWNEWGSRLPTVIFLGLFAFSIYRFYAKTWDGWKAVLVAAMFLSCGRILFWDSFLGLIDVCFSWVCFLMICQFYHIVHHNQLRRWMLAYVLLAIAFLLKTFPAVVFFGCSLLTVVIWKKRWKMIFSIYQFAGVALCLALLAAYYLPYFEQVPLQQWWAVNWSESSSRTAIDHQIWDTLKGICSFPFEYGYHFLLWSALTIFIVLPKTRPNEGNPAILFSIWVFVGNIWLYWISPSIYPRYLFALMPFLFAFLLQIFDRSRYQNGLRYIYWPVIGAAVLIPFFTAFHESFVYSNGRIWKSVVLLMLFSTVLFLFYKYPKKVILLIAMHLMCLRIGFDWFVFPHREAIMWSSLCKADAIRIGQTYKNENLQLLEHTTFRYESSFYISRERNQVLERSFEAPQSGALYIVDKHQNVAFEETGLIIDSLRTEINKAYRYIWRAP